MKTSRPPSGDSPRSAKTSSQRSNACSRLVVLDADPRSRVFVDNALTAHGYEVFSTGDTAAAVRAARQGEADIVLVDIGMSVLDVVPRWERRRTDPNPFRTTPPIAEGYAILRPLLATEGAVSPLIVFLKEEAALDRARAFRFGILDYLPKPVQPRLLLERVEEVFVRIEEPLPPAPPAPTTLEEGTTDRRGRPRTSTQAADPSRNALLTEGSVRVPVFDALPQGLRTGLIVDPDETSRAFLRNLLAPHGFTLYEAADGEEGLRLALDRRPWLILSDVNMSKVDGFEFCRQLRAHSLLRHIPFIFFSAWDDYAERYLGLQLGADEFISKATPDREILIRLQLSLKRYSDVATRTGKGPGMVGRIELIGATGMLQMCHLGRFSGVCTVRSEGRFARIGFRNGEVFSARCGRSTGAMAIHEFVTWTRGQFEFVPGDPGEGEPVGESFDLLLLESCRLLDEAARRERA